VPGPTRVLRGDLYHYSYADVADHIAGTLKHARTAAEARWRLGRRASAADVLTGPLLAFLKKIVLKQAWRDGVPGLIIAFSAALNVFTRNALLWEKARRSAPSP